MTSVQSITRAVSGLRRRKEFLFWKKFEKRFSKGEIYLVGGAVRDFALGRPTTDYDFIVRHVPAKQLMTFLKKHGRVDLVGKRFGVLKFMPRGYDGEAIDIALPRTDYALHGGGGYRDFDIQTDAKLPIEDDLARRDFTVNAIAIKLHGTRDTGHGAEIIDPFGGLDDLKKKTLRTVGKPEDRFAEDYSRMLRGLRFACQLDFTIETKTWRALRALMPKLNRKRDGEYLVPRDAIGKELVKSFAYDPVRAAELWDKSHAFVAVMPEVLKMKKCPQPRRFHTEGDVWKHSILALEKMQSAAFAKAHPRVERSALFALTVFLHDIGKPYTLRTPKKDGVNRVRTDGHDTKGAEIARDIADRLRLSQFPKENTFLHVDANFFEWLIAKHMLLSENTAKNMKATTLERYFLRNRYKGDMFKALIWCDSSATIAGDGKPNLNHLRILNRRLTRIEKQLEKSNIAPLLSGDEVMRIANIQTGPYVGQLLEQLREEQLTGRVRTKKQARAFMESVTDNS